MDSKTIQKLNNLEDTIEQAKLESLGTKGLVSLLDDTLEKIYCDEDLEEKTFPSFQKVKYFLQPMDFTQSIKNYMLFRQHYFAQLSDYTRA